MTTLLLFLGLLLFVIGGLMLIVAMFCVSIWWGIFGLIFSPLQIVFVIKYWSESRSAIVTQTIGLLLLLAAVFTGGDAFTKEYKSQFNRYLKQAAPEQMQELDELQSMMFAPDSEPVPRPVVSKKATATQSENKDAAENTDTGEVVKTIYQCVDKNGNVSFIDKPCTGKQEKVITIRDIDEPSLEKSVDGLLDKVKQAVAPVTASVPAMGAGRFRCDGRTHCSQMTSCEEAEFFLANCPGVQMDGNRDGQPCEEQWCSQ